MWGVKNNKEIDEVTFSFKNRKEDNKKGSKKCFDGKKNVYYPVHKDGYNRYFDICADGCNVLLNTAPERIDPIKRKF